MIYENIELSGSLDVSGSFIVPNGPSSSTPSNPDIGSLFFNTTDSTLYEWIGSWSIVGTQTGPPSADIEYLVVAGGGSGGAANGGGGGAGGYLSSSLSSIESGSSITVSVGAGGSGITHPSVGNDGGNSSLVSLTGTSFTTITSIGGGGGGKGGVAGRPGGSGGGGSYGATDSSYDGGAGTAGQGFAGGNARYTSQAYWAGAGGGGASEVGADASAGSAGGDGGDGKQSSITGTATYYAGGGGGGAEGAAAGAAGLGGASAGQNVNNGTSAAATANTGGGSGGGPGYPSAGTGNGGSGVVILAYDSGSINGAGGIIGDAGNGRKYHQFNQSGTFKAGSTSDFSIVTSSLQIHLDAGNFASRGTSTWTDISGNGKNATVNGPTLGSNYYYDFDGSNDYISLSTSVSITDLSVEFWIQFQDFTDGYIWVLDNSDNPELRFAVDSTSGNKVKALIYDAGAYATTNLSTATFSTDTWYHLVLTITNNDFRLYVNGTLDNADTSGTYNGGGVGEHTLGTYNRPGTGYGGYRNSNYAQFRYYSKVLSAAEVLQNYNATKTNFV